MTGDKMPPVPQLSKEEAPSSAEAPEQLWMLLRRETYTGFAGI
jgi:hypothetical protein